MAKIMLIDDDVELSEDMAQALKEGGHTVAYRDETHGAIEAICKEKPDLLVLDVMFPENQAGGFDLARKIRQTNEIRDLPVILLTGVNQEFPMGFSKDHIDPDWMPVQEFAEKPIQGSELLKKVNALLAASRG